MTMQMITMMTVMMMTKKMTITMKEAEGDGTDQVSDVAAKVDGVPNHEGCRKSQNNLQ